MKSNNNNSTVGRGTPTSREHGLTMGKGQTKDKNRLKQRNGKIKGTKFVRVRVVVEDRNSDPDSQGDLIPEERDLASFRSEFSALRRNEHDNLGYRIPRLVQGPSGEKIPMPEQRGRKKGTKLKDQAKAGNRKMPPAYSVVVPGQPDIDAGVDGWIQPTDTRDFVRRGNRMDILLETFNRVTYSKNYEKDPDGAFVLNPRGEKIILSQTPYVKPFRAESSMLVARRNDKGEKVVERVKTDAKTLTYRNTIGVSPGLSRALQRLLEDGHFLEARKAIEATVEPFGRFYEATYRGPETHVKVTSLVPHLDSGHFHYDTWNHSTYLASALTGVDEEIVPVRRWDAKASCHYGPGPGVTFWMRHFEALGDLEKLAKDEPEAAKRVGYTKLLCEQAIAGCRQRAESSFREASEEKLAVEDAGGTYSAWIRPADDYARDVRVSKEADRLLAKAIEDIGLEKDYVAIGMAEYRGHLIEAYKTGNTGIRMDTVEDLAEVVKVVERAELRARGVSEANKKVLLAAELLMQKAAELATEVEADKVALKTALVDALEAKRVADDTLDAARKEAALILADARKVELNARTLMDELPSKMVAAELRGVEAAYKGLLPDKEPVAETMEGIIVEIETEIQGVREAALAEVALKEAGAELRGVKAAYKSLSPDREPVAETVDEIVVEIQTGIQEVRAAALAEVVVKEAALEMREKNLGELTRKAKLWDSAEGMIKRVFELFSAPEKEQITNLAGNDSRTVPTSEVKSWKGVFSRLAVLAGILQKKDRDF